MDQQANKKTYFRAPWSNSLTISTLFFVVLLGIGVIITNGLPSILIAVILLGGLLLSVTGYSIKNGRLYIHRLGWRHSLDLTKLTSLEIRPDATQGSIRVFGMGGMFASVGYFNNALLGRYRAYLTDAQRAVVLDFDGQVVVISPDDPHEFARAVREITRDLTRHHEKL